MGLAHLLEGLPAPPEPKIMPSREPEGQARERLQQELAALERQYEKYTLALDAAVDARASLKLSQTVERLETEMEALQEALASMPARQDGVPDLDDEPATSIYDSEDRPSPAAASRVARGAAANRIHEPAAFDVDDPPTMPFIPLEDEPQAGEHMVPRPSPAAAAASPSTPTVTGWERPGADPSRQPPLGAPARTPAPPSPRASAPAAPFQPPPASADGSRAGLSTQPQASSAEGDIDSPFGAPAPQGVQGPAFGPDPSVYDPPIEILPKAQWSWTSRLILAAILLPFLGLVGWVLLQGP